MVLEIPVMGVKKIVVPDPKDEAAQFLFEDGQALAVANIDDALIEGVIRGRAKIFVLVPDHFPIFLPGGGGSKIMAEFYIGLLEPMLEKVRDELFPDLKPQANRDKIVEVGQGNDLTPSEVMRYITQTSWVTYDPLEQFLLDKLKVGFIHSDGTYTIAEYDEERMMENTYLPENMQDKLFYVSNKYYKGLDTMFMGNLEVRHRISDELMSENTSNNAPNRHF
jgi:hypothetical protein